MLSIGTYTNRFNFLHRNMGIHQNAMSKALMRLSTGKRINSAADDAAGLAVAEKMRAQLNGLGVQKRNAMDEILRLKTMDSGMADTQSLLQEMRDLALQASNGTYSDEDRALMDVTYQALMKGIDDIYQNTRYNGVKLKDMADDRQSGLLGLEDEPSDVETELPDDFGGKTLRETSLKTVDDALEAAKMLERSINAISSSRAGFGANINVLDHEISYLETAAINAAESLSTIEDADMAAEMMNFSKAKILMEVTQALMAHTMDDAEAIVHMLMQM